MKGLSLLQMASFFPWWLFAVSKTLCFNWICLVSWFRKRRSSLNSFLFVFWVWKRKNVLLLLRGYCIVVTISKHSVVWNQRKQNNNLEQMVPTFPKPRKQHNKTKTTVFEMRSPNYIFVIYTHITFRDYSPQYNNLQTMSQHFVVWYMQPSIL